MTDKEQHPIKGQWFLSVFLIAFGLLIVWGTVFGGLLNIFSGIILMPIVIKKFSWQSKITKSKLYAWSFALFVIGLIFVMPNNKAVIQKEIEVVHPMNIIVSSQIVKQVGDRCRYFFDIRNKDSKPFEGSVKIDLITVMGLKIMGETFGTKTPMLSNESDFQYIDLRTCPRSIHGDNGIVEFVYKVKNNNEVVKIGSGDISDKFEDLN